ncbi:MAG: c-type cytochrome [Candidatus Latescibacteria bacterium]|nr:c-type cytochrome [Candidatus Latescibacterota bacterium]
MFRRRTIFIISGVLVVGIAALALGYRWWRTKNISPVQRGFVVALNKGCFTCHGPGGLRGAPNPGYSFGDTPAWDGGTVMQYVENEQEIREWILDGVPARIRNSPDAMRSRQDAVIQMPGWRGKISTRDLDDLVAFFKAVSDFGEVPPEGSRADEGRLAAWKLGCFSCHGPQGRGTMPNVRAFKGYIPSWDGDDFPDLVANDQELRDWILDGGPKRILEHPVARWFIQQQPIKMPAYRRSITDEQVEAIIAYIHWLRGKK